MSEEQACYWLLKKGCRGFVDGVRRAADFVCCEVPTADGANLALEVFTTREGAEAELEGMRRLARGREEVSEEVVELAAEEVVALLVGPEITYVLVDPPPVDQPIPEGLRIEPTPAFGEKLRPRWRHELGASRGV